MKQEKSTVVAKSYGPAHGPISDEQIVEAMRMAHGFISVAARNLKCSQNLIRNRAEKSDEVSAAIEEIQEQHLDLAESKLLAAIDKGEPWAIKFMLAYKGKSRGYQESKTMELKPSQERSAQRIPDEQLDRMLEENRRSAITITPDGSVIEEPAPAAAAKEK